MHKVCTYLLKKNYVVTVYGRVLPDMVSVERPYNIIRKNHVFNHKFFFYAEYNIRLFIFLVFNKFDVILSNDLDTLPACYFASKIKGVELVYDSHELFSEGPELQGRKFVSGFWRSLEKYFLPKLKKSYTVSKSIADFYDERHKNNMGVIRNIPMLNGNFIQKSVSFPTKNNTILYQGVLNPGRGIKPMIKALHFIDNLDLIIIGYGKVEEELREFVTQENMNHRVHFLGRVARELLPNYTKLATLGMVLEEPLGKSFEYSLPNKLFDYIHAELPIVAGNMPEINRVITKYKVGVMVKDYTPKNIAYTIKNLLADRELLHQIKKNQQKAKHVLCWEKESEKLDNYF